jgi:regulator of RNase E activity RraA
VVGYAFTSEWTPLEPTAQSVPWESYYLSLGETPSPLIAVMKDVDSRPGRGATFGDNMAAIHKMAGVVGVVVDGTVRDIEGIERVGMPVWATGQVPGHGVYNLVRFN